MLGPWSDNPLRLLCTWARWLSLRHATITFVNVAIPAAAVVVGLLVGAALADLNMTGEFGLIHQVNGLLQILAPSFVAALALVAGFPGDALDRPMGGNAPYMNTEHGQHLPSRREVLGLLFAYLAGLGTLTYLAGGLAMALSNPTRGALMEAVATFADGWAGRALAAAYAAVVVHLFAVTLLGLHFLGNFLAGSRLARSSAPPAPGNGGALPHATFAPSRAPAQRPD
jgi:hypothetical protein